MMQHIVIHPPAGSLGLACEGCPSCVRVRTPVVATRDRHSPRHAKSDYTTTNNDTNHNNDNDNNDNT